MRLLHTSDWHLGATLDHAPRDAEHAAFLAWLDRTVREREVEVLVVAGDVFQTLNPPAEALALYFGFLARVRDAPSLRKVVVVGGNHDSAARLDAPEPVLDALDVHVVGGWAPETVERCVCGIRGASGDVELVVAAVPFVHEYRLGVRTAGRTPGDIQIDLRREFERLYDRAAEVAASRWLNVPLVGTGHLTCVGAEPDDYESALHLVRTVGGFPPDVFSDAYRYVALGHIHRMIAVQGDRVRYSGTPIALNTKEARSPRYVLQVDIDATGPARVAPIEVPVARPIVPLEGPLDEVVHGLRSLSWETELEPYVLATIVERERLPNALRRLHEVLESLPEGRRPRLVRVREHLVRDAAETTDPAAAGRASRPLAELDPEDVFRLLYATRNEGATPPDVIVDAFRSLLVGTAP